MTVATDRRRAFGQALVFLVALWLVACGLHGPSEVPRAATPETPAAPALPGWTPAQNATRVTVYLPRLFEDGSLGLRAVARDLTPSGDSVRDALESLIRGPDGDERAADFQYALDRRTRVVSTRVEGGAALVELDDQVQRVHGRPFAELVYWSIVYTLTEIPGVERVSLQYRGERLPELGDPPFSVPTSGSRANAPSWARPR